jgi:LysR family glycine cleavage system transcriptional activator
MPVGRLPPLHTLEAFEAAAELLSFKAAGERLHRTPSAVSHQLKALETHLGVALFRRFNRGLELTAAGRAYRASVQDALAALRDGGAAVAVRRTRRRLAISMGSFIAAEVIVPRLGEFSARYPDIDLVIDTDLRIKDLARDNFDLALRFGRGDWPGATALPLMQLTVQPVCAPALAPARASVAALARLPRLSSTAMPDGWKLWSDGTGVVLPEARQELWFDSFLSLMQAAERGLGVSLALRPMIDGWLHSGRLVAPWQERASIPMGYYLLYRPGEDRRPELRALIVWIQSRLAELASLG